MNYELPEDEKRRQLIDDRQGIVARCAEIVLRVIDPIVEKPLRQVTVRDMDTAEEALLALRRSLDALELAYRPV